MRYTVILVPDDETVSVSVPAMPGCVSQGRTRDEALANVRQAMVGWLLTEAEQGRQPLADAPEVIAAGVAEALEILEEMRSAGETSPDRPNELELTTIEAQLPVIT